MPELARRIASRLRHILGDRRHARRGAARLSITVGPEFPQGRSNGFRRKVSLDGHTLDVSTTGLALVLPAIRIGEHYLTGNDRTLWLKVDLPDESIEMKVIPVRYESLDIHASESGYIIGVIISSMSDEDRAAYNKFVQETLKRNQNP